MQSKPATAFSKEALTKQTWRQNLIDRHGWKVQETLEKSQVALIGLGGMGSLAAICLARAGVGKLTLVDFDRVELSNLNRQQYSPRHIGLLKTQALAEILVEIHPWIELTCHAVRASQENLRELCQGAQVIAECTDRADTKAQLAGACRRLFPDIPLVSCSGMAGTDSGNTIHSRRISKNWYIAGDETTDTTPGFGLLAPRVAIASGHQAHLVLRLLLGEKEV